LLIFLKKKLLIPIDLHLNKKEQNCETKKTKPQAQERLREKEIRPRERQRCGGVPARKELLLEGGPATLVAVMVEAR
jgi:hypothetical protein